MEKARKFHHPLYICFTVNPQLSEPRLSGSQNHLARDSQSLCTTHSHPSLPQPSPVEPVSSFQYLGSVIQEDCGSDLEVSSRICKASQAFGSLSHILLYQKKIRTQTKLNSHFQFCHHSHTALWYRMCCVVAVAYPSLAKLHHALFAYHPGYLCL